MYGLTKMSRFLETMKRQDAWEPTRLSLVSRLRDWQDQDSWQEFFVRYWKLIYSVAIKSGLSDQEAEDVVQETVLSVARKMPDFVYDRARCTFKGWLMHVTRLRIADQFRRRGRSPGLVSHIEGENGPRTDAVERIPDERAELDLEAFWEDEWRRNLLDAAMQRVKGRVNPDHYQIFHLHAVKEYSGPRVAAMLGVSLAKVYVVRHRVARLIRDEVKRLESETS